MRQAFIISDEPEKDINSGGGQFRHLGPQRVGAFGLYSKIMQIALEARNGLLVTPFLRQSTP